MKEQIKKNWFKILLIIILAVIPVIYYQNQQAELQLKRKKQENDYKIDRAKLLLETEKEERIKEEKEDVEMEELRKKVNLELCLETAEDAYWSYIKLNGTLADEEKGTYNAYQSDWDEAEKRKKSIEDKCFNQYK
ncbi:hypothetical protein KAT63_04075 [Candidatus Parcubacteria bacterium]|nr:hypothetical protein [Candidatus Parcubacteria bacterium]